MLGLCLICDHDCCVGTPPVRKQVSPTAPTTPTKESSDAVWPERQDSNLTLKPSSSRSESVFESPAIAWSASGSSRLTAQKLDSVATGVSSMGVSEPMTADNVSKVSYDSRPISSSMSVEEAQSLQHKGRQAVPPPNNKIHHASRPIKVTGWKRIAAWFD